MINQNKKNILIIDDEKGIRETLEYVLTSEGFKTGTASTGRDGLNILKEENCDLIILDIGLPDTTGFELLREIRKFSEVPVLFLTARSEEIDRILGLELGADDYVVKPFSPREVSARVKAILRRIPQASINNSDKNDLFRVDENKRIIYYNEKPLSLSRYEYEMILLFLSRPGWVFTRDAIMEHVWTEPEESFDRTVDAHIKTIRSKLKEIDPDTDPIKTHRGVGYSLREDI